MPAIRWFRFPLMLLCSSHQKVVRPFLWEGFGCPPFSQTIGLAIVAGAGRLFNIRLLAARPTTTMHQRQRFAQWFPLVWVCFGGYPFRKHAPSLFCGRLPNLNFNKPTRLCLAIYEFGAKHVLPLPCLFHATFLDVPEKMVNGMGEWGINLSNFERVSHPIFGLR